MAQKVNVILEDDIDGGEAVETIVFGLNGQQYEIDLSEKNAAKLRKALAPFVEHGRRQSAPRRRAAASRPAADNRPDPVLVRAWALKNGHEVNARGRVPAEVIAKYEAAH